MASTNSMERMARVARKLGSLCDRMVFIGGAVAPLLHTDQVMPSPRATEGVASHFDDVTDAYLNNAFKKAGCVARAQ